MDTKDPLHPRKMISLVNLLEDLHKVFLPRGWSVVDITRVSRPRKVDGKVRVYYTCYKHTRKVATIVDSDGRRRGVPYTDTVSSSGSVVVSLDGWSK